MSAEQRQSESPGTVRRLHEGDSILAHDPALAEIVRRLVAAYQPEWVYLFGSVARGEAGPDSDYDLLVVVQDTALPERCDSDLAYRVLRGTGIAADVVVWTAVAVRATPARGHLPTGHGASRREVAACRLIRNSSPKPGPGSRRPAWISKPQRSI